MKTKELISSINDCDNYVAIKGVRPGVIGIYTKHVSDNSLTKSGEVSELTEAVLDLSSFPGKLTREIKNLVFQYAYTPLSDRTDKYKYMIRLPMENKCQEPLYLDRKPLGFSLCSMRVKDEDCKSMEFTKEEVQANKKCIKFLMGDSAVMNEASNERAWFIDNYWLNYKSTNNSNN